MAESIREYAKEWLDKQLALDLPKNEEITRDTYVIDLLTNSKDVSDTGRRLEESNAATVGRLLDKLALLKNKTVYDFLRMLKIRERDAIEIGDALVDAEVMAG